MTTTTPEATVRTFLVMRALEGREDEFEREWLKAAAVISRVRGQVRQDLLRNSRDPREFTIVSEWTDPAALQRFSASPERERLTEALRDLREGAERMTFDVLHTVDGAPQDEGPGVRVLCTTLVQPGEEAAFEAAYEEVAEQMRGTPGHVREELLHEPGAPTYHLLAEWLSRKQFLAWVQDPGHQDNTGPLIPYLKRAFSRKIFDIVARPEESIPAGPAAAPAATTAGTDVLIVGAGPTGLTLALELARRGVAFRLVDKRPGPNLSADKAIGVHCRTMEIWEDQGIVHRAIDRGIWLDGQIVVVNGQQTHRVEWDVPELPYAHLGLPQYETEDLLTTRLAELGHEAELGTEVTGLDGDDDGVTVRLRHADGRAETVRAGYVVGCDGAHSVVRKRLGLKFAAGAGRFPQLFMLCDVEVDWDMPPGYLLRFIAQEDGEMRGMLVCVPLKGADGPGSAAGKGEPLNGCSAAGKGEPLNGVGGTRYRIATMAPPRVMAATAGKEIPPGFQQELEPPTLEELQVALDRLAPPGTTARNLRWSSVFRISHGIVESYRQGRMLLAGDAAHLHPPAGGHGMNTGIQDAYNLGWKLALTVTGAAAEGLLDSYEAERRPAGEGVVGRAVKIAFTDEMDFEDERQQFLHEMHMLQGYGDSALVGEVMDWELATGPGKGMRAPDVHGLTRRGVGHPLRLFDLTAGTAHTVLLYVDASSREAELADHERLLGLLSAGRRAGLVRPVVIASPDAKVSTGLPVYVDGAGAYRATYSPSGPGVYVVRPDGYVGFRSAPVFGAALTQHLNGVLAG